jgi:phosphatidylserine/phosphatidylglycerophosphate/cardiolipin synthase-like enzyme
MKTLQQSWGKTLSKVFQNAADEITISSPYISNVGADFLLDNISSKFKNKGNVKFLTDLSAKNIYQNSTNPKSVKLLVGQIKHIQIYHLPRLHAKAYISDKDEAIITSGNLTAGGLYRNFEYGLFLSDSNIISQINNDLIGFGKLGALISIKELDDFCLISDEIKAIYKKKENTVKKEIEEELRQVLYKADSELIQAKLDGKPIHYVFERSILYILKKYGALETAMIHSHIETIHPDLCGNVDRIINGVHFGKKWKHAVRTAQQNLKKKDLIELSNGLWHLK